MSIDLIYISDKELPGFTKGKEYKGNFSSPHYKQMVTVKVGDGWRYLPTKYFITKKEWRDLKIKEILNQNNQKNS